MIPLPRKPDVETVVCPLFLKKYVIPEGAQRLSGIQGFYRNGFPLSRE
jgi:hypothetical protein